MSSLVVHTFVFDDENMEKFASHGLTERQIDQILDSPSFTTGIADGDGRIGC